MTGIIMLFNKDALWGVDFIGGDSPPANPIGYNGRGIATFQMEA
jgi:hypothetical protein